MERPPAAPPAPPPPAVLLVLGVGAPADALEKTGEELRRFGVSYTELAADVHPAVPGRGAGAAARVVRMVIVASADQETPAAWACTGVPTVRVPVAGNPGASAAGRLALLVPGVGGPPAAGGFATVAIGDAGARNAALFAVAVLAATGDEALREAWSQYRRTQTEAVLAQTLPPL